MSSSNAAGSPAWVRVMSSSSCLRLKSSCIARFLLTAFAGEGNSVSAGRGAGAEGCGNGQRMSPGAPMDEAKDMERKRGFTGELAPAPAQTAAPVAARIAALPRTTQATLRKQETDRLRASKRNDQVTQIDTRRRPAFDLRFFAGGAIAAVESGDVQISNSLGKRDRSRCPVAVIVITSSWRAPPIPGT